ncbi:hypothetical protein J2Z50_002792 [Ensifer mexicanus]|nr:hypothetical protein [Sinorhizobium mexicanum]
MICQAVSGEKVTAQKAAVKPETVLVLAGKGRIAAAPTDTT